VYCDVLEHVVVTPLLRIVNIKHATENGRMHEILNPPLYVPMQKKQEGQHPLTGQRAANFRLLANQRAERRLVTQ